MMATSKAGGVAAIVFTLAFVGWFALENHRSSLGFEDADNPDTMVRFLREHADVFALTGLAFVVMAVALAAAVLAVWDAAPTPTRAGLSLRVATAFGLYAAAYFFAQGVLRVQTPGTLLHMDGLDHDYGLAAYLAVQMAGTQGLASAGGFALSAWAVGVSALALRTRFLPRGLAALGILPAIHLVLGLLAPLLDVPGALYLLYILALFGAILWTGALGVALLRRRADA